jgi:hypothetical protein
MVSADQSGSIKLAFSEKRSLVWAAALECAKSSLRPYQRGDEVAA